MPFTKLLSLFLSFSLIFEQTSFAQVAQTLDISGYLTQARNAVIPQDKFRPLHLRYISYDNQANDFKLFLDKGDYFKSQVTGHRSQVKEEDILQETTQELMRYFFIGLALPNDKFWVNLRPDSPDNIIDDDVAMTDIGRIFLEADVQLKKDTAGFTSPQTPEGKDYWDKLYKRAEELFGTENITIPTLTRPWIVPNEIIIRESPEGAYIYKATLKVMLEEDYLKSSQLSAVNYQQYNFKDQRLKELNEYSTQLIKETIIPKLTYQVNTSKRYAPLRQVYYSLILAQWFKQKYQGRFLDESNSTERTVPAIAQLIDSGNLTSNLQLLTSQSPYSKDDYFQQYQKSFKDGEYNIVEPVYTPYGQSIRRYMSGGMKMECSSAIKEGVIPAQFALPPVSGYILPANTIKGNNSVNIAGDSEISEFIRKLQNLIESAQDVEHKQVLMVLLEKLQRSPPEFERAISRIIKREFKIRDLNGNIDVLYYAQGSSKIVYKVTFHASKENFDILVIFKKESGNGRIQPNEIADLVKLSTLKIKDLKLVPIFGFSLDGKNGRVSFLEEFIEGKTVLEHTKENPLTERLRNKIVATLFSIGILLGNVFPKDVNGGNFIITPEEEVVMVDIGNKRFSMGEALKYKNYNSMVEFLFLIFLHYGRGEKDHFLIPAFYESLDTIEKFMKGNSIYNIRPGKTIIDARREIFDFLETARNYLANISDTEMGSLKKKLIHGNPYLYSYFKLHNINDEEQEAFVGKYLLYIKDSLSLGNSSKGTKDINFASSAVEVRYRDFLTKDHDGNPLKWGMYYLPGFGDKFRVYINPRSADERNIAANIAHEILSSGKITNTAFKYLLEAVPGYFNNPDSSKFVCYFETASDALLFVRLFQNDRRYQQIRGGRPLSNTIVLNNILMISGGAREYIRDRNPQALLNTAEIARMFINAGAHLYKIEKNFWRNLVVKRFNVEELQKHLASSAITKDIEAPFAENGNEKGGIDFAALPIQAQTMLSSPPALTSNLKPLTSAELDAEWAQIQAIFNAGIRPSIERLSEYTAAASVSPLADEKIDEVRGMLADMLRREEEDETLPATQPALKNLIASLESDDLL